MKKPTTSTTKKTPAVEVATREGVREILLTAAKRVQVSSNPAADARLLSAAKQAQCEGDSFTDMWQTSSSVTGLLELLAKLVGSSTKPPADTNWASIANLIEDAARRNLAVEAGLYWLMDTERAEREATNAA